MAAKRWTQFAPYILLSKRRSTTSASFRRSLLEMQFCVHLPVSLYVLRWLGMKGMLQDLSENQTLVQEGVTTLMCEQSKLSFEQGGSNELTALLLDRNVGEAEDLAQSAKNAESQTEVSYLESNSFTEGHSRKG